jgi:UDP-2,4-diacetamido-2,4,6-trideoxy-beta-L-altropyranose hydrolase
MRFAFRVDASSKIGTGHVSRCLALADGLRSGAAEIDFMCTRLEGDMVAAIERAGFSVSEPRDDGMSPVDWLVVDHYDLDQAYEYSMRRYAKKILVIDDLANRRHECDLLLDQNLYDDMQRRYHALVPAKATVLAGPRYALLRPEFSEARSHVTRGTPPRRIMVFFGGSDPTNETAKVLRALAKIDLRQLSVEILVGGSNPRFAELKAIAATLTNTIIMSATDRISEMMLRADVSIGAGGSTTWERCCLGLPSLSIAVAENQVDLSSTLARRGYQRYLGTSARVSEEMIAAAVVHLMDNYHDAATMGLRGMDLVDGLGTTRVLAAMEAVA